MNISVTTLTETSNVLNLRQGLLMLYESGYVDWLLEPYKVESAPSLALLLLERVLSNEWVHPIITNKKGTSVINQRLQIGYDSNNNIVMLSDKMLINVTGLFLDLSVPDIHDINEKAAVGTLSYINLYNIYFFKKYLKYQFDYLNITKFTKFKNDEETLLVLKLIYGAIKQFMHAYDIPRLNQYLNNAYNLYYTTLDAETPLVVNTALPAITYNDKPINFLKSLKSKLVWCRIPNNIDIGFLNTMIQIAWLSNWEKLMLGDTNTAYYNSQIEKYNLNYLRAISVDESNLLVSYFQKRMYPDVPKLSDTELKNINNEINKYLRTLKVTPKETLQIQAEFMSLFNNPQKKELYVEFLHKWKLVDSDNDFVYDSTGYPVYCPHIRNAQILNTSITMYNMYWGKSVYCKICGEKLLDTHNISLAVTEIYFYTDISFSAKQFIWKEIIKLLTYVDFKHEILVYDLVNQMGEVLYPLLQIIEQQIHTIKTLHINEKYIYFKTVTYIYIWALLATLQHKSIFVFTFIDPKVVDKVAISTAVYAKLTELLNFNYKQYTFLSEQKLKAMFFNTCDKLRNMDLKIKYKTEQRFLNYFNADINPIYGYIEFINKFNKRNLTSLEPINGFPLWNDFLLYIAQINSQYVTDQFVNDRLERKAQLNQSQMVPKTMPYILCKNNLFFVYRPLPFDITNLSLIYGLTESNTFHKHSWKEVIKVDILTYAGITNTTSNLQIISDFKCKECNKYLSKVRDPNIGKLVALQQELLNFYNYYFILCLKEGLHEISAEKKCVKCGITVDDIIKKQYDFFIKHKQTIQYELKQFTIPPSTKVTAIPPIETTAVIVQETTQIINKFTLLTKNAITFIKYETYIEFLMNLGTASLSVFDDKNIDHCGIRSNQLNIYIQNILFIIGKFNIVLENNSAFYNYTLLLAQYDILVLPYVLLQKICLLLGLIQNNVEILTYCVRTIYNYEILLQFGNATSVNVFDVKEVTIEEDTKSMYDNMDYEEHDDDAAEELEAIVPEK